MANAAGHFKHLPVRYIQVREVSVYELFIFLFKTLETSKNYSYITYNALYSVLNFFIKSG